MAKPIDINDLRTDDEKINSGDSDDAIIEAIRKLGD